jgi:uncharacterized protein YaaW (UPF0174 family)
MSYWPLGIAAILALVAIAGYLALRRRRYLSQTAIVEHEEEAPAGEGTISVTEIERSYQQRAQAVRNQYAQIDKRTAELKGRMYEGIALQALVEMASDQERSNLATVLKLPNSPSVAQMINELGRAGSHVAGRIFRRGKCVSYGEVVRDVASKVGASLPKSAASVYEAERAVLEAAFRKVLEQASPEQQRAILNDIARADRGSVTGLGVTTVTLAAAHLSGFALYTAASATLGAITGAVGITLPFATYMGLSSFLATITGPAGWAALAGWAIFKLGGVDYKKTIPAVVLIGTVRTRLIAERDQELKSLIDERSALEGEERKLEELRRFLDTILSLGPSHQVATQDVPL